MELGIRNGTALVRFGPGILHEIAVVVLVTGTVGDRQDPVSTLARAIEREVKAFPGHVDAETVGEARNGLAEEHMVAGVIAAVFVHVLELEVTVFRETLELEAAQVPDRLSFLKDGLYREAFKKQKRR